MLSKKINNTRFEESTFLSCEKDIEQIIHLLFHANKVYSEKLKRLLIISNKDCLDTISKEYADKIAISVKDLIDEGYINITPRLELAEHDEVMNKLIFTFDNFTPNSSNPYYNNNVLTIDIICHSKNWDLGNYRLRPLKIAGYIDSVLRDARLSGIGTLNFLGMNMISLNENWSGYSLVYQAIHGNDDRIEP